MVMPMYPFDVLMVLNGATAITADGAGSVAYFDTGSASARYPAVAVIDVSEIDLTSANETYDLVIQGSADTGFSAPVQLASMVVTANGRYHLPFFNEQNDITYRYLRLYVDVGGTTPSLKCPAFLAPLVAV